MATNFKLKRSSVANKRPGLTNLELGELALNTYDGFLFTERNGLGITTVTNLTPWYENYGAGSIFYTNKVGIGTTAVPDTNQLLVKGGTETDRLNVTGVSTFLGVSTFNEDVTFTTANGNNIVFDKSDNALKFGNDVEARFGLFQQFRIRQNGTTGNSEIIHNRPQALVLHADNLDLRPYTNTAAVYLRANYNDGVDLYFANSKKFETTVSGISVTGTTDTDNFINTGISTFVGIITASATENVIPFLYSAFSDLPSASAYHGAFAHVHARGKGYFAHAANWYELVNKELDGTIGVGTEQVRVGVTTVTDFNATGNVTLGDADTDNIVLNGEINSNVIPNTNIAYDLGSTTKRWRTLYTGASTKIDSDIVTRNLSVTGLGTFANDVTFTGASYNAVWDQSDNALEFADNAKATFGNNNDLQIYHDSVSNHSFIKQNSTTNVLKITADFIRFNNRANNEVYLKADNNGAVELYYDNTKRLSTSGAGVTVYNQLDTTNINASGIITAVDGNFTGNVSIAGTLTYQDVTNVDSVGIATARVGLKVLSGGIDAVGVITATGGLDAIGIQSGGVNITTGIITAINFTGTGNTVTYDSSTKIVSVSVGGAGGSGTGGKFVENNTGIHTLSNVGIGTTNASDKLKVLGDVAFTGALKVSPLGLSGSNGNYLKSVGTGVTWAAFPTARTVGLQTATANQTSFSFTYNVGFLDVYINGVKLTTNEFTATNGTSVVLNEGAFVGDQVQFISFNTTASGSGGGGGGGISNVVEDSTPQLGGNLDLNSNIINGTGNIDYTGNFKASGIASATTFVGNLTGNVTGTATEATNVTVSANNTTNETVYPVFVDGATGTQGAETDTGLTYNPNTGNLTATKFSGDGSSITGISTSNITNYGVGLGGGGSIAGISTTGTSVFNNIDVDGTTNLDNVDIVGITTIRNASGVKLYEGVANGSKLFHAGTERLSTELYGIDINGTLGADQVNCSGIVTGTTFSGSGASLTNLPAANLTGTLPAISGANLTNLDASDLASGTIPDARFPATLPAVSGANLTGIAVTEAPVTDYTITANGSSAYRFAGGGVNSSSDNPDLYLVRGQKYRFNNTTGSSHPFAFRDSANGANYTSGISGSQNGIQFFTVPLDAPALLKYRCTIHTSNMVGNIYIRGAGGHETNVGVTTFSGIVHSQANLGIGINSPARELHVHSSDSGSTYIAMTNSTTGVTNGDGFAIGLGGDEIGRIWNYETTSIEFGVVDKKFEIGSDGGLTQTSTAAFQVAKGTTAQRPSSPVVGMLRFNTQTDQLENYNATSGWQNVSAKTPNITSITGDIYAGMATNLTINVTNATSTVTVIFKEGSTTKATLTNQSVSSNSLTVAVPSAVYGESAGDTITITVTNDTNVVSAGSDKTIQTSPSGGTITTSGNYRIHTFTSSGNFVNTVANLGVEYLIIAGGGGGGSAGSGVAGGGGGAGGYRSNVSGQSSGGGNSAESAMTLSAATYAVVVGAGAAKPTNNADQGGVRGSNSSFNSIVSIGGGGGGGNGADAAQGTGGSGGGGKESDGAGSAGTSGQGYAGGDGSESGNAGGGGGGAGEAGNTDGFAHGGDGVSSNITGSAVVRGGGGSSGNTQGLQPAGGDGGGAQASTNNQVDGGDGTANTGGGGGGGYSVGGKGGAGGSGIVIVRYNTTTI